MSQSSVLEFIQVAKADNNLRSQLESATNSIQVKEIAIQKGYNFTEEEIITNFKQQGILTRKEDRTLSEKELETVAGGDWEVGISIKFKF